MSREQIRYREHTPWNGVIYAVLWGSVLLACYPILAGWDGDVHPEWRIPVVVGVVAFVGVLVRVVAGLTVVVDGTGILMHLGRSPIIRRRVDFGQIESLRSVRYRPIAEFGGWGVRGRGRRKVWSARGTRAVALSLSGDRELLIGSDHPQRLEERIRTIGAIGGG